MVKQKNSNFLGGLLYNIVQHCTTLYNIVQHSNPKSNCVYEFKLHLENAAYAFHALVDALEIGVDARFRFSGLNKQNRVRHPDKI